MSASTQRLLFLVEYQQQRTHLERILGQLMAFFEELRRSLYADPVHRVHSIRGRVKEGESLWNKWEKKVVGGTDARATSPRREVEAADDKGRAIYRAMVTRFSDLIGVRIVCNTLAGKQEVCRQLLTYGPQGSRAPLFSEMTSADQYYKDSGYRSVHFDARLLAEKWPALAIDSTDLDGVLAIEIQVRTILEEAWGEIQHDLLFKPDPQGPSLPPALFLALSHRLHEADLNVQRLIRGPAERIRLRPSVQQSIPTDLDALTNVTTAQRDAVRQHLSDVEKLRQSRAFGGALSAHTQFLARIPDEQLETRGVIFAERALDYVRQAERLLARRDPQASSLLDSALADYDATLKLLSDDVVIYWRRSRVWVLKGAHDCAMTDLRRAIALSREGAEGSRWTRRDFYHACLYRSLTPLLWRQASETSDAAMAGQLRAEAYEAALRAYDIHRSVFQKPGGDRSDVSQLHFCDILNNRAWLEIVLKRNLVGAAHHLSTIEREIRPGLWEQDVFLLGTRLRLRVEQLEGEG